MSYRKEAESCRETEADDGQEDQIFHGDFSMIERMIQGGDSFYTLMNGARAKILGEF
jgi:hypothetical protein